MDTYTKTIKKEKQSGAKCPYNCSHTACRIEQKHQDWCTCGVNKQRFAHELGCSAEIPPLLQTTLLSRNREHS